MIVSTIRMVAEPHPKEEILEILFSVKGPAEAKPGCVRCCIYQDLENEKVIVYEEIWRKEEYLYNHICSSHYYKILAAVDLADEPPDIAFNTISNIGRMELIKTVLGQFDTERKNQGEC